jgi:DNA-binding XRE family transcriptional regulator
MGMKKEKFNDVKLETLDESKQLNLIATYIKELRFSYGFTQKILAKDAEVHYRTIQNIESGKKNFAVRNLIKVISVFDLDLRILFREIS